MAIQRVKRSERFSLKLVSLVKAASTLVVVAGLFISDAAALGPEETVKEIVGKIQVAGNPTPIVEYVDWEGAFATMPQEQKVAIKVQSAKELKAVYLRILQDPISVMKEQVAQLPEAQRAQAEAQVGQMEARIKEQKEKMSAQIKETQYNVTSSEMKDNGKSAVVKLTQSYQGKSRDESIDLIMKNDKWLLATPDMFKPQSAGGPPPGAGAPKGPNAPMKSEPVAPAPQ